MKAVDTAVYGVLATDIAGTATGTLGQLGATGPYRMLAPQTAVLPYVVFNQQAGTDYWTFRDREHRSLLYQVQAVTQGHSGSVAAAMNDRFDAIFNDVALSLTGWNCLRVRRESDVEYAEESNGIIYQHVGGLFRIDVEPQ